MSDVQSVQEIQYYSALEQELKQTQIHKAKKFVELGKIVYEPNSKCFLCLPIDGYNKTTYTLKRLSSIDAWDVGFECNCQGYQTKLKREGFGICSHVLALHYLFDKQNREKHQGRYSLQTAMKMFEESQ